MGSMRRQAWMALVLGLALVMIGTATSGASAQGPRGQPFADFQQEIDALGQRVGSLEGTTSLLVDCNSGGTIASALAYPAHALIVNVQGTCNENLTIGREDVTLLGATGATVSGPDNTRNTITVTGARVTIDNLIVTGGRNGISGVGASRLSILRSTVQNTGRSGIVFFQGANGTVDGCTVQDNLLDGIDVESASATLTNNTVQNNRRWGVRVSNGGSGRIGVNNTGQLAANTVGANGEAGVHVTVGASAFIAGNTINDNGTNQFSTERSGITVFDATAYLGGNTIRGNFGPGVLVHASKVFIGEPAWGMDTITGNGLSIAQANFPFANGGVFAYDGAVVDIRNSTINGNTGSGVALVFRSNATIQAGSITGNTSSGVSLHTGSGVIFQLFQSAPAVVSGNGLVDGLANLQCNGGDARYTGFGPTATSGIASISGCPSGF